MQEVIFLALFISVILFEKKKSTTACLFRGIVYSLGSVIMFLTTLGVIVLYVKTVLHLKERGFPENIFEMFRGIMMTCIMLTILTLSKITGVLLTKNALNEKEQFHTLK